MASTFAVLLCFHVLILHTMWVASDPLKKILRALSSESLGDLSLGSEESSSSGSGHFSGELKKYHKYLGKSNVKSYKDLFKKQRSDEEKSQLMFYEDLLKKMKQMYKHGA